MGEIVHTKTASVATKDSTKLQPRNRGRLVVAAVLPSHTYRVVQLRDDDNSVDVEQEESSEETSGETIVPEATTDEMVGQT